MILTPKQIAKFLNDKDILFRIKEARRFWKEAEKIKDECELKEEIESIVFYENETIEDIGELLHLDIDDISNIKYCNRDFLVWFAECKKHLKENTLFIF